MSRRCGARWVVGRAWVVEVCEPLSHGLISPSSLLQHSEAALPRLRRLGWIAHHLAHDRSCVRFRLHLIVHQDGVSCHALFRWLSYSTFPLSVTCAHRFVRFFFFFFDGACG